MVCQECHQHTAGFTITQILGTRKSRRYLCENCAQSVKFVMTPCVLSGEMWEYMKRDPLLEIIVHDERYSIEAYHFVSDACQKTALQQMSPGHLSASASARELLATLRREALELFGKKAKAALNSWGVRSCEDFGEIVFQMMEAGVLGSEPGDSKDDFRRGYDFGVAFPNSDE